MSKRASHFKESISLQKERLMNLISFQREHLISKSISCQKEHLMSMRASHFKKGVSFQKERLISKRASHESHVKKRISCQKERLISKRASHEISSHQKEHHMKFAAWVSHDKEHLLKFLTNLLHSHSRAAVNYFPKKFFQKQFFLQTTSGSRVSKRASHEISHKSTPQA